MNRKRRLPSRGELIERAKRAGFTVRFIDHYIAASARCPHLMPAPGICDQEGKEILVATMGRGEREILAILMHELEHAEGAEVGSEWPEYGLRCGSAK